jgi:uncharacterized protein (TIGR03546 family)
MTLLFKQLFALVKMLNSDTGTNQLASGFAVGFILGMTPALSLQSLLVFICLLFFRIQIGAAFISAFFFSFLAWILDPVFHSVGSSVLEVGSLQALFTTLYNLPLVPFTRFNNTIVMGSGVISVFLSPFVFLFFRFLIVKYRVAVVERFQKTKFWKAIKSTAFFKWYYQYDKLYG